MKLLCLSCLIQPKSLLLLLSQCINNYNLFGVMCVFGKVVIHQALYWGPRTLGLIRYSNSCDVGRSVGIAPFTDMWDWGWKRSWDFPTVKQERPDSSPVLLSPSPVLQLHCKIPRRIRWRRWILLNSSTFCQILLWKDLQFRTCL